MRRRVFSSVSLVLTSLLAASAGLFVAPAGSDAAFPGTNGVIAFTSNRNVSSGEIYTMSPGGPVTRVTTSIGSSDPAFSPEGSRIAYISNNQVWMMNADGTGKRQITSSTPVKSQPAWSPDGGRLLFVANSADVDGQTDLEIWRVNTNGTGLRQLTNNTYPDEQPAWSPDGGLIAFVSNGRPDDTDRNIYLMNANGSLQVNITWDSPAGCTSNCYKGHDDAPAWSPDGSKIAYVHSHESNGGGTPDIWVMDSTGANHRSLSNNGTMSELDPAWSPDGTQIVYRGIAGDNYHDIWLMNSDGSNQRAIETGAPKDEKPDWQPIPVCTQTVNANNDPLVGTSGRDVLCGDHRNNVINGVAGNDIILGLGGADLLSGDGGNDIIVGGSGSDTASFLGFRSVNANLMSGIASGVGVDTLLQIENLTGGRGNDKLVGTSGRNVLNGGRGDDRLFGYGSADTLKSRDSVAGNDHVNGGAGPDTCTTDATEASIVGCP